MGRHLLDEIFSRLYSVPVPEVFQLEVDPGTLSIVSTSVANKIIGRLRDSFKEILDPRLFAVPTRGFARPGTLELRACLRSVRRV